MVVDLDNWADRLTYFLARYYDAPTQAALMALLAPGDRFVDVGANNGMLTLLGAKLVGAAGRVDAFEPHPECRERITRHLQLNRIEHVTLHEAALGTQVGHADLHIVPHTSGYSTLAPVEGDERAYFARDVRVTMLRGDDALQCDERPVSVIKIDVEGYEGPVLRGLPNVLSRDHPIVITEVNPFCLRRAGWDASTVLTPMLELGYTGYRLDAQDARPRLEPLPDPIAETMDVLWVHPSDRRIAAAETWAQPSSAAA